jgi:anti-anti-sigma factor
VIVSSRESPVTVSRPEPNVAVVAAIAGALLAASPPADSTARREKLDAAFRSPIPAVTRLRDVGSKPALRRYASRVGSHPSDPPEFSLAVAADGDGRTTVSVAGELDMASADVFATAVREALAAGDVVIDLADVSFMDSSGLRALNAAAQQAGEAGRELRVADQMQPGVVRLLELTGMLGLLRTGEAR